MSRKRLRVFDLTTPLFWLVIFFRRQYGEPWLEASLYQPPRWKRWWLYVWQWEEEPSRLGAAEFVREAEKNG